MDELGANLLGLLTAAARGIVFIFEGGVLGCERWRLFTAVVSKMHLTGHPIVEVSGLTRLAALDAERVPRALGWLSSTRMLDIEHVSNGSYRVGLGASIAHIQMLGHTGPVLPVQLFEGIHAGLLREAGAVLLRDVYAYPVFGAVELFDDGGATAHAAWECWQVLWDLAGSAREHPYCLRNAVGLLPQLVLAVMIGHGGWLRIADISKVLTPWFGFTKDYVRQAVRTLEQADVVERQVAEYLGSTQYRLV